MVEMTMLVSLCDTTMLQFMPYKAERSRSMSTKGWPSWS